MAKTNIEQLVAQLNGDIRGFRNSMREAVGITNKRAREIEQRWKSMNSSISNAVTAPLAGLGAALSVREITRYADEWTRAGNLIRASAQYAGVQVRSLEELSVGADNARTSLSTYADLYAKLIRSSSTVAKSEEEIALATNLVSKAMKAGGAATQEQQAAILQLGQALGSGVLQGDELRSLRENAPVLAQAIADEFEVTIAGLKKLGEDGKLTSDRVFRAIINAQAGIEAQFAQTNQTIADGFTKLGNAVTEFIGKLFETTGATNAINTVLGALAGNVESVAAAAAAAGAVILSTYIPAVLRMARASAVLVATNPFIALVAGIGAAAFALSAFGDDFTVIKGDMATFGDYARTVWDGISDGAVLSAAAISDSFLGAINLVTEAISGVSATWLDVGELIKAEINREIGLVIGFADATVAAFAGIGPAVAEGIAGAVDGVITMVERMVNTVIGGVNQIIEAMNRVSPVAVATLGSISIPRVTGELAGSIKNMETAVSDAFNDAVQRDYVGEALAGIRESAETNAFIRKVRAAIDAPAPISTAGYGSGLSATPGAGGGGGKGKGKGKKAKENEYQKEIEQIKKRTAALQAETAAQALVNPLIDDYGYAVERAGAMQELLTAAQEAGLTVTPQMRAQMEELSEAYAQAVVAGEKLSESQEEIRQRAEDSLNASRDMAQGYVQDLLSGQSAAEAFGNALGRLADRFLDLAFDNIFSAKGPLGGGGGGIMGLLGSLFGGFRAGGGSVQAGKAYVVGERHPELFVPSQNGRIIPKVPNAGSDARRSTMGVEVDVRTFADQDGNWHAAVDRIATGRVQKSRAGLVADSLSATQKANRQTRHFLG